MPPEITSSSNERIKWLVRLRDRRHRDEEGAFVVEGARLFGRAIDAGLIPVAVFTDGSVETGADVVLVESSVLDKASYRQRSEGLIAVFRQFPATLEQIEPSVSPLILIAEDIEKPGNLGAMMRSAAAAGVDALIIVGAAADPFNPNAIRSSTGGLFTVPLAISSWETVVPWLSEHDIEVVAATPQASTPLWEADLSGPTAIVIGAEDDGLSEQAVAIARRTVRIPQHGNGVDSLNASVAAAVVLFEAVRQRTKG